MFALTGVMLALLLGPYVRAWYVQREQIAEQIAANQALKEQVDQRSAELRRWNDPAFVRTQARSRLNYVLPGETGYVVLDDRPDPAAADPGHQAEKVADPSRPWYGNLWESVQLAGKPVPVAKP
jgi:hypothetical protein